MTKGPSDDCFAIGEDLMPLDKALGLLRARLAPVVGTETVALREAAGRVLAAGLHAPRDVPGFDNAAVDGYAFAHASLDTEGETRLPLYGVARAGAPMTAALPRGTAAEVFTGAPIPEGADTVVMIEDTRREGHAVILPPGVKPGANVRRAGEDIMAGTPVLEAGQRLRPQDLGLAAAVGAPGLEVHERLRVAVFSTGNELAEPGDRLPPGGVHDVNRPMLSAILEGWGFAVSDLGILPDDPARLREVLAAASEQHEVILSSGGASRSTEDHVVRAVGALGRLDFWRIAIKPGRPLAFGRVGGVIFVGLPGNPVAAAVCLMRIARPALFRLAGAVWREPVSYPLPAAFVMTKKPARREFLRGSVIRDNEGRAWVQRFDRQGSGVLTSMVATAGLIELPEALTRIERGDLVDFVPYCELFF
ncbi:MAG: molybdopterin molybdenumtransferase MoeA [Alphaproteobacteria bacterium]|nr:MAG: molybdopterin molybdenumtransferase MoeA [Alphaproteobacteria bacterium]